MRPYNFVRPMNLSMLSDLLSVGVDGKPLLQRRPYNEPIIGEPKRDYAKVASDYDKYSILAIDKAEEKRRRKAERRHEAYANTHNESS